jgi:hypothetical protein
MIPVHLLRGTVTFSRLSRAAALLVIAASVISLAACSSPSAPPIALETSQDDAIACIPTPDPGAGASSWDSPVGSAIGMYYNQSDTPATVTSVSLLDPHNLTLHGAVLYKMAHYAHALSPISGWKDEEQGSLASDWARRQPIPGAVIPSEEGPIPASQFIVKRPDIYQVAVDVSATTRSAGWALGMVINYKASGRNYTLTLRAGIGIAPTTGNPYTACKQITNTIQAGFKAR